MASTNELVESCQQWSSLAEAKVYSSNDASSDCSTDLGDHDCFSRRSSLESQSRGDLGLDIKTLTIFDWDDTIFPTTWMQTHGLLSEVSRPTAEQLSQLERLAECARLTLELAVHSGKVVVVTNAEQGWLEKTCRKFMPSLVSLLKTVDIVSARSTYKSMAKAPSKWKQLAFSHEVDLFKSSFPADQYNIVSIGDSLHELRALISATEFAEDCWGKSLKFVESPSIEQLIEQHELLADSLVSFTEEFGDVDVEVGAESAD